MKFSRTAIIIVSFFLIIIGVFIISHTTPSMSIRSHTFINGYPIGAFRGTMQVNKGQYNVDKDILDKENSIIYTMVGYHLYDRITENTIANYKVKKIGFLYFAEDYGEG
ncbi:hypothetical protein OSC52_06055 [Clostridium pasteurianum]|uniref:hypothetical protein n=1 Tax=Clostridium pasteurianum TaxID=1501 RepID=UPI00226098AF|nr:hypothetical protein [Clostridium pasteurianum]UZW15399.1 hypothetical protein OSC52_06055 [Clostridium pasteurianum]